MLMCIFFQRPTPRDSSVTQLNACISDERCSRPVCPQPVSSGCRVGCDDKELKDVYSPVNLFYTTIKHDFRLECIANVFVLKFLPNTWILISEFFPFPILE